MFSNSTEYGKWLNGVRHPSINSDPRCPVTAGSVVPISTVEAVGLESVQHRQPAAQNRVHTYAEQVNPAQMWVSVPYPYGPAGSSGCDSGIAKAKSSAYLGRDHHSQSMSSDPLRMGHAEINEPSSSFSVRSRRQFPSEHWHLSVPLGDSTERLRDGFINEARGTWLPAGTTDQARSNPSVSSPNTTSVMTSNLRRTLQTFNGTGSLDTFLNKFHRMAKYLHWDEEDEFNHLCASLEGVAGQVLWDVSPQASTQDLVRLLQTRFGTEFHAECFKAELRARRRASGNPFKPCTRISVD